MNHLEQSIERLYTTFADQPKPRKIEGCPCCVSEKDSDLLLSRDLKEITPGDLSSYASSALLTVGTIEDYLYFLPRILHINATDDSWWPDPAITGRAIHTTLVDRWPAQRIEALQTFLLAVISDALDSGQYYLIDDWICAIGRMEIDVQPFLKEIESSTDAVISFYDQNASTLPHRKLSNAFWEIPSEAHDKVVEWFCNEKIRKILVDAYGFSWPL